MNESRHLGKAPFGCGYDPETKHLISSTLAYWYNPTTGKAASAYQLDPATRKTQPVPDLSPPWERRYFSDSLRALADIYAIGDHSFLETRQALNAAGWFFWDTDHVTPKPFNRESVRSVVRNWHVYAGELPGLPGSDEPGLSGGHAPILPLELCYQIGAVYRSRSIIRSGHHGNRSDHTWILSGLLYCGTCDQKMSGQRAGERFYYRHMYGRAGCKERFIPAAHIEGEVIDALEEVSMSESLLARAAQVLRQALRAQALGRAIL